MQAILSLDREQAKALKYMKKFTSKDKDFPILQCLHFEVTPGKVQIVAADGYRLAVYALPCQSGDTFAVNIPAKPFCRLLSARYSTIIMLTPDVASVDGLTVQRTEGKYPNWQGIIGDTKLATLPLTINPQYLHEFAEWLKIFTKCPFPLNLFTECYIPTSSLYTDSKKPHVWTYRIDDYGAFLYMVMPMNWTGSHPPFVALNPKHFTGESKDETMP